MREGANQAQNRTADVFQRMKAAGWDKRPGVRLVFGRWQDTVSELDQQFDGIFFDTYSEYYEDLRCANCPCSMH